MKLDIKQIDNIIPQKYPFLLIDQIEDLVPGKKVVGVKNVSMDEPFFEGHFPGDPIMPGVLVIEAMAQTGMFLYYDPDQKEQKISFFLGAIKDVRFFKPVVPGDILKINVEPLRLAEDSAYVKGEVLSGDEKVATGEFIFVRKK